MSAGAEGGVHPTSHDTDPEGTTTVPGTWLDLLATTRRAKLFSAEWRVVAIVLASPRPVTAAAIARRLRLAPTHARAGGADARRLGDPPEDVRGGDLPARRLALWAAG